MLIVLRGFRAIPLFAEIELSVGTGSTMHHLFALLHTLRISRFCGLTFSTAFSILDPPAAVNCCSALSHFHTVSRAIGPSRRI